MRSHRILLFSFVFFLLFSHAKAQFSLFAGPQQTIAKYEIDNGKQETSSKTGFMAGIRLTTQVEGPLYFSPALYYSRKGYKVTFNRMADPPAIGAINNNKTINALCIAPLLQLNLAKAQNHFFVRFGPALDVAISGKEAFDSAGNKRVERSMLFGSTAYSPITAFANIHLGFEHKSGFSIFAHYEHGLSSLNNSDYGPAILHRVAGLSLGWRLKSGH